MRFCGCFLQCMKEPATCIRFSCRVRSFGSHGGNDVCRAAWRLSGLFCETYVFLWCFEKALVMWILRYLSALHINSYFLVSVLQLRVLLATSPSRSKSVCCLSHRDLLKVSRFAF